MADEGVSDDQRLHYEISRLPKSYAQNQGELVDALSTGVTIEIACEAAGIVKDTFIAG